MAGKSGAIRAGRAYLELFADKSKLVRGLKSASRDVQKWASGIGSVGKTIFAAGAALTTPILGMVTGFALAGSALVDMSQRTGASVEQLSTLKYAAEQSGASMEDLEGGMRKAQKAIADAAHGSDSAAEALKRCKVSAQKLKGLTPDEQFRMIADGAASIADPGERAAAVMGVMGKSATSLLPLMNNGAAGITELQQAARDAGLEMSTADAAGAEEFGDMLDKLWSQLKGTSNGLAAALLPALMDFATEVSSLLVKVMAWVKDNRGLVVTIFKIGLALVAGGAALIAFGYALSAVAGTLGFVAGALPVLATVLGAILSPIGLVVAGVLAVGGAVTYLLSQTEIGQRGLAALGRGFAVVAGDAKEAWGGMAAALSTGDLGGAAAIAWGFIKLEFARGLAFVQGLWHDGWAWIEKTGLDLFFGTIEGLSDIWGGFQTWFSASFPNLYKGWIAFTSGIGLGWTALVGGMSKLWTRFVGWIKGQDVSEELRQIDATTSDTLGAKSREFDRQMGMSNEERTGEAQQAQADRASALQSARDSAKASVDRAHDAKIEALTKELEKTRANFSKSVADAKEAATEAKHVPSSLAKYQQAAGKGVQTAVDQAKVFSVGTFNGATAAQALNSSGELDKIAANTLRTANNTGKKTPPEKAKVGR
ncbi:MAG: hypothetical protein K8U03_09205 [Planctomycetia bacterium]|nr:hypothetical protein [Planctomycetia bacterium]